MFFRILIKNQDKLTVNHLWERQSKALGLSLTREKITILVACRFQQQPQDVSEGACFTWTHAYTFTYVLRLLLWSWGAKQADSGFEPKVSFPWGETILLFWPETPYKSSGRPRGTLQGACWSTSRAALRVTWTLQVARAKTALAAGRKNRNDLKKQTSANMPSSRLCGFA